MTNDHRQLLALRLRNLATTMRLAGRSSFARGPNITAWAAALDGYAEELTSEDTETPPTSNSGPLAIV